MSHPAQFEQPCDLVEYRHQQCKLRLILELLARAHELCRVVFANIFEIKGKIGFLGSGGHAEPQAKSTSMSNPVNGLALARTSRLKLT